MVWREDVRDTSGLGKSRRIRWTEAGGISGEGNNFGITGLSTRASRQTEERSEERRKSGEEKKKGPFVGRGWFGAFLGLWQRQKGPDRPQVPDKEDKGPDLAAPVVAVSKEFHHIESGVERRGTRRTRRACS